MANCRIQAVAIASSVPARTGQKRMNSTDLAVEGVMLSIPTIMSTHIDIGFGAFAYPANLPDVFDPYRAVRVTCRRSVGRG